MTRSKAFNHCIFQLVQAIYFTLALLNDIFGSYEVMQKKKQPFIRKIKDYLFSSLALPVALNVGITFWSLFWINRELVFPKALDEFFPSWLNHIMHTNIIVFILLELFTSFRYDYLIEYFNSKLIIM